MRKKLLIFLVILYAVANLGKKTGPVPPPDEAILARMPMPRDEYEKLRPRSRFILVKQKLLNMIARITIHPGVRLWLYRQMGVNIGRDCVIEMYANLDDQFPELIYFEDHSGPESGFVERHGFVAPVRLKRYSAVSAGSIVLPGVTLHEGALVGAGAVVTKDIPAHSIAVGVPARVIKRIPVPNGEEPVESIQAAVP
jgi:acetyltransferase-like isoleucine patch superfamily enzyme